MMDDSILQPLKMYDTVLKQKFHDAASQYFDKLIRESETEEDLNRQTVKKYNKAAAEAEEGGKKVRGMTTLRAFLYIITIILFVVGIGFIMFSFGKGNSKAITLGVGIPCVIAGVGVLLIIFLKVNKIIKERKNAHDILLAKAKDILNECYRQTAALCNSFDWNIPSRLIRAVTPLIQLDDYFDAAKFDLLNSKYGFGTIDDTDTSTELVLSGTVVGNPFLVVRNLHQFMQDKLYTGFLTISWQERTYDSEGHVRYVTRTQTLTASIARPCPGYEERTYLVYGNEAAPKLRFTRNVSGLKSPTKEDVEKYVKHKTKDLENYADKMIKEGKSFTPMANNEFEALFHAWDRNDDVQFRLLYTPLAQQNMTDLICDNKYFGDDFYFEKRGPLNFVVSGHSQNTDLYANPFRFLHYDVDHIREHFINYMDAYFKSIYFDLAPVLSVPLYQQQKPLEYIYKDTYPTNFTTYENETMANAMEPSLFAPDGSNTKLILKSTVVKKNGKTDKVVITAHSFRVEKRLELVPTMGGDGFLHDVPVYWDEYIPIEKDTAMAIKAYNTTRKGYEEHLNDLDEQYFKGRTKVNGITYQRGLISFLINEAYGDEDDSALDKAFSYNKENKEV